MIKLELETPITVNFDNDGTETVTFNPAKMNRDEFYPFAYQGELWALKKCHRTVSVMKFADCDC
jgi:hypothetical protein